VFCRSLLVHLSVFFLPLYCLFFSVVFCRSLLVLLFVFFLPKHIIQWSVWLFLNIAFKKRYQRSNTTS
jgi:hypothetical protein